jgi:cytochrome c peroxidase
MSCGFFCAAVLTSAVAATTPAVSPMAALGGDLFRDPSLSASGRLACATCHDPRHAYGPPDGRAVQPGGAELRDSGLRAVPSLRYTLSRTPVWSKQYQASDVERVVETDSVPVGGFDWDGRFNTLREQAASPLLSPREMGNTSVAEVATRLSRTTYASRLRALFGEHLFDDPQAAFNAALQAIERFELEDASFHPYSSRYDGYLAGRRTLSATELRGLNLFNDPATGNCSACHTSAQGADGSHPLFTDFSFAALGVPRNAEIPANAVADYFDLGLCGPLRTDLLHERRWCGLFKTPTLRNAAARGVFFHNGRVHTLRDAVRFYAERDLRPERWYPPRLSGQAAGAAVAAVAAAGVPYDDLPAALRGNVNHIDAPLDAVRGAPARLSDADIDDIVAFIATLTDADVQR